MQNRECKMQNVQCQRINCILIEHFAFTILNLLLCYSLPLLCVLRASVVQLPSLRLHRLRQRVAEFVALGG